LIFVRVRRFAGLNKELAMKQPKRWPVRGALFMFVLNEELNTDLAIDSKTILRLSFFGQSSVML
jgi:hypothetical protein